MSGRLTWLASYPKSGNTWVRAFLASYDRDQLPEWSEWETWHGAGTGAFYEALGLEASDLTRQEAFELRPDMYRAVAHGAGREVLVKVHDAFQRTPLGRDLFPQAVTQCALYLVRNPLDVAVSWAHHAAVSFDDAVEFVCDDHATFMSHSQLPQKLGSWSHHITSWLDQKELRIHLSRYEDLLAHPAEHFGALVAASGRTLEPARLARALAATEFGQLQAMEARFGFVDRPMGAAQFFRQGKAGGWRAVLSQAQVDRIRGAHHVVMDRLGYSADALCSTDTASG